MQVELKILFTQAKGTMYQIRNVINGTCVLSDPGENMNGAGDFILLLVKAHVIAAAKVIQSVTHTDAVMQLAKAIITDHIRLPSTNGNNVMTKCMYMPQSTIIVFALKRQLTYYRMGKSPTTALIQRDTQEEHST